MFNQKTVGKLVEVLEELVQEADTLPYEAKASLLRRALQERGRDEDLDEVVSWFELEMDETAILHQLEAAHANGNGRNKKRQKVK